MRRTRRAALFVAPVRGRCGPQVRGKDSLETFEELCRWQKISPFTCFRSLFLQEALQIGKSSQADLILHGTELLDEPLFYSIHLGGDLFHENKPSRACLYRTMNLLRQYTLGSGEVAFEVVSDPSCFSSGMVNFHDPNMNVECPMSRGL